MLMLRFQAGDRQLGLPAGHIVEVLPLTTIHEVLPPVPGVVGTVEYEGSTIPVADVTLLLCGVAAQQLLSTRIVIVTAANGSGTDRRIGLVLERATQTVTSDEAEALGITVFDLARVAFAFDGEAHA
jgi:chemotaxis-related protein WspB